MDFPSFLNATPSGLFGPLGLIIIAGVVGVLMVVGTIIMILKRPEDPLTKLKRSAQTPDLDKEPQQRLRQHERNEQLQRFASFLEPQDDVQLSKKQLQLRQAGYQSKDAVRIFHFAQFALAILGLLGAFVYLIVLDGGEGFSSNKKM
ncbi:MAG: type II secretion system F family protein, partial [Tateyamaria sp.]